jgi:hypothetical protein
MDSGHLFSRRASKSGNELAGTPPQLRAGMLVTPAELPIDLNEPLRDSFAETPHRTRCGPQGLLSTLHLGPFDGCLFVSQDLVALEGPQKDFRTEQVLEAWGLPGPGEGPAGPKAPHHTRATAAPGPRAGEGGRSGGGRLRPAERPRGPMMMAPHTFIGLEGAR